MLKISSILFLTFSSVVHPYPNQNGFQDDWGLPPLDFKSPIWDILTGMLHLSSTIGLDPMNSVNAMPTIRRHHDNSTEIEMTIHGVNPDAINITIDKQILTVEHTSAGRVQDLTVQRKIHEEFWLPPDVKKDEVTWNVKGTHLSIHIPPSHGEVESRSVQYQLNSLKGRTNGNNRAWGQISFNKEKK